MSALAVFVGGLIILNISVFMSLSIYIAMVAAFLIAGAGNAVNDYVDVDADKINKPKRPIPSGKIKPRPALAFSAALFAIGILLALVINKNIVLLIAAVNTFLLIIYPLWLQNKILLGNISISYLVGSTFLFGGAAAAGAITEIAPIVLLLLLAFFANLAREIVKDLEDVEGDRTGLLKRLRKKTKEAVSALGDRLDISSMEPTLKYKKSLVALAEISIVLAIIVSPMPYFLEIFSFPYLIFLIPTDLFFLLSLVQILRSKKRSTKERANALSLGKKIYRNTSRYIKLGMLFGLLAFVAGALL